jgi:hypothetical protein
MTSTTQAPKTERVPGAFAGTGAVRQSGGSLQVFRCNGCKREVVWVKSQRTQRHYLCNVRRGYNDQRFYQGNDIHESGCAEKLQAERDEQARRQMLADLSTEMVERVQAGKKAGKTADELVTLINSYDAKFEALGADR